MHNFEFLRMVNIGQYLPLQSTLNRLDARARILIFLSIITAATFTRHALGLGIALSGDSAWLVARAYPIPFCSARINTPAAFPAHSGCAPDTLAPHPADAVALFAIGPLKIYLAGFISAAPPVVPSSGGRSPRQVALAQPWGSARAP